MTQSFIQAPIPCVVVVEDDVSILELLRELLTGEGLQVITLVHPGLMAKLDRERQIDVFLIDMMLPGETGLDLATRLRVGRFAGTPMIALSASQTLLHAARASGLFQDAVAKPFDVLQLLDTIKQHAEQSCHVAV